MGSGHLLGFTAAVYGFACFLDFWSTEGDSSCAPYLLKQLKDMMEKHDLVGRVSAVMTDTPNANKALWRLVEEDDPQVDIGIM